MDSEVMRNLTANLEPLQERPEDRDYSGYFTRETPAEDAELTHAGPGTPAGEYLRRYWQPVALASEVRDRPLSLRVMGESLVLFRMPSGALGLVHKHCPHRGASLEYGIVEQTGIRCAYHGWVMGAGGRVLEAPASNWACRLVHGAYPTHEYKGLVFAYLGPPEEKPPFPVFDTTEEEGTRLVPFCFTTPCNWVQIGDNGMDPIHTSFLHMIGFPQFGAAWSEIPEMEFRQTPIGMIYVTAVRMGRQVWIRANDAILPNISQSGSNWVHEGSSNFFSRASMLRWKVPLDDATTLQIGWRMFNDEVDPEGRGDPARVGMESIDLIGQSHDGRSYAERQAMPSDYDILVSQRPIAVHRLEHLGEADRGVVQLRRLLRAGIRALASGPATPIASGGTPVRTFAHDTIVALPDHGAVDCTFVQRMARGVTDAVLEPSGGTAQRREHVRRRVRALVA